MVNFSALAVPGVQGLTPYPPGKPISELERELGLSNVVKLASNENPLGPSPKALVAARAMLDEIELYPDGGGFALKAALSAKLSSTQTQIEPFKKPSPQPSPAGRGGNNAQFAPVPSIDHIAPEQITLGSGSSEVLELLVRVFVAAQHEVVFSQHAFALYPLFTQAVGAKAVVVPAKHWGNDLTAMRQAISPNTRLVFIANPNNPTGTWLEANALESFMRDLPPEVLVVVDEAYFEYASYPSMGADAYPNTLAWVARYPNLIVARTFSKCYGLAGLRVGYAVSHAEIAELMNRLRPPFNVNSVALAAALAALDDAEHLARSLENNTQGMKQLEAAFTERGLAYIPSVGNFVCVDVKRPAAPLYDALLRQGVIVRPVGNYDLPQHLRVTVGTMAQNEIFLRALDAVLTA